MSLNWDLKPWDDIEGWEEFGTYATACGPGCTEQIVRPGKTQCDANVPWCPNFDWDERSIRVFLPLAQFINGEGAWHPGGEAKVERDE